MSLEHVDRELERLVGGLIPVAKARVLQSSRRSPESFADELSTLASLYVIGASMTKG